MPLHWAGLGVTNPRLGVLSPWFGGGNREPILTLLTSLHLSLFPPAWKVPILGMVGLFVETPTGSSPKSNLGNHCILEPLLCWWTHAGAVRPQRQMEQGTACPLPLSAQPALRLGMGMIVLGLPGRGLWHHWNVWQWQGCLRGVCGWQGWRVRRKLLSVEKPGRCRAEAYIVTISLWGRKSPPSFCLFVLIKKPGFKEIN